MTDRHPYFVTSLKCVCCGKSFDEAPGLDVCPDCGLEGILDPIFDYNALKKSVTRESLALSKDFTHWRYSPLLPVRDVQRRSQLSVGWTPLYHLPSLAAGFGLSDLWVKDDGLNPTGSLKDRASSIAVARSLEEGASVITASSTGNAASSLAGAAASVGLKSVIFVPRNAPAPKVAQLRIFGADVFVVDGTYEDAFNLSMSCVKEFGWYNRNCAINPWLVDGKKTVSLEMCEQLQWNVPDIIFYAVGDGCSIYGTLKGFENFHTLELIDKIPRIVGVQAEGAAPIYHAWKEKRDVVPEVVDTLADSIAVGTPRNWRKALAAVERSEGWYMTVSDDEILDAMRRLGAEAGVFGEPAGVTGFAGLIKAAHDGDLPPGASVGVIVSGNGLKDAGAAIKAAGEAPIVPPDFAALRAQLSRLSD